MSASTKPLFLISNDDGVHAPGIRALERVLRTIGDTVMVAPHVERSATSQSISIHNPLRVERLAENVFAVEGTPADSVMLALRSLLPRKPDFVVTGINRGANLGLDTLYSGTVGAALEGLLHGIPGIAFSLHGYGDYQFDMAAEIAKNFFSHKGWLNLAKNNVLNINIPNVEVETIKGFAVTSLGRRRYEEEMLHRLDPRGREYYWIGGGGQEYFPIPGSDCAKIEESYVTITALQLELTDREVNQRLAESLPEALRMWKK